MDVGTDFLQPEFLNLLFFQQKNLVIFPYIDLKHLHALETFTVGYNIIDIESTALYNLREIIEGETINSYSQNPNLFLIYNLDDVKLKEILEIEGIRCILNTNENVSSLSNGQNFIFYNKKTRKFLNFEYKNVTLDFEKYLITTSQTQEVLFDNIQKIKASATRIFKDYVETGTLQSIGVILKDYPKKFWKKILEFIDVYFDINLPPVDVDKIPDSRHINNSPDGESPFYQEYKLIISHNRDIRKEFTLVLHDYRAQNINPANLELEELINPQKLYIYLRTHHWKKQIPKDFLNQWVRMKCSNIRVTDELKNEFLDLFNKLGISLKEANKLLDVDYKKKNIPSKLEDEKEFNNLINKSIQPNFLHISSYIKETLNYIERLIFNTPIKTNNKTEGIRSIQDFTRFRNDLFNLFNSIENYFRHNFKEIKEKNISNEKKKKNSHDKQLIFIVDGANAARFDKDIYGHSRLLYIKEIKKKLYQKGANKVIILCDASLYHDIDDKLEYTNMIKSGLLSQTPAGTKADPYILAHAKKIGAYIISCDLFREYREQYGIKWLEEQKIPFQFIEGNLYLDPKIERVILKFQ